jgi:hypothetical protein
MACSASSLSLESNEKHKPRIVRQLVVAIDEVFSVKLRFDGPQSLYNGVVVFACPNRDRDKRLVVGTALKLILLLGQPRDFQDNVEEGLSGVKGANSVKIVGRDLATLEAISQQVLKEMASVEGVTDLGIFPVLGQPNLNIKVNRDEAARYGLNAGDINNVVQAALGGRQFRRGSQRQGQLPDAGRHQCLYSAERTGRNLARYRRVLHLSRTQRVIINETLERGFASILRNDDYEYYASLPWPKGARRDSKYGLLFRASLSSITDAALTVERWAFIDEPKLAHRLREWSSECAGCHTALHFPTRQIG